MPTYCYETSRGDVVERVFKIGTAPASIEIDGRIARRSFSAERIGVPAKKGWPMECLASGVNASQAGELRAHLAAAGVPTEVTKDGNPVYRDARHRRKALKVRGFRDNMAFC
jgi:hypothetical protein